MIIRETIKRVRSNEFNWRVSSTSCKVVTYDVLVTDSNKREFLIHCDFIFQSPKELDDLLMRSRFLIKRYMRRYKIIVDKFKKLPTWEYGAEQRIIGTN